MPISLSGSQNEGGVIPPYATAGASAAFVGCGAGVFVSCRGWPPDCPRSPARGVGRQVPHTAGRYPAHRRLGARRATSTRGRMSASRSRSAVCASDRSRTRRCRSCGGSTATASSPTTRSCRFHTRALMCPVAGHRGDDRPFSIHRKAHNALRNSIFETWTRIPESFISPCPPPARPGRWPNTSLRMVTHIFIPSGVGT